MNHEESYWQFHVTRFWYQIAYDEWVRDGGLRPKANPNDYFFKAAQVFSCH